MVVFSETFSLTGPLTEGLALPNEAVFVVGDVHGQRAALETLLTTFGGIHTPTGMPRRLVFLGDLIDRGPDSLGCLHVALNEAADRAKVDAVTYLPGNHELMLADALLDLEALRAGTVSEDYATGNRSPAMSWMMNGGAQFLTDVVDTKGPMLDTMKAFADALPGENGFANLVRSWPSGLMLENLLFVHAGVQPKRPVEATLAMTQASHFPRSPFDKDHDVHWAWIRDPFLMSQRGFVNAEGAPMCVFHGHSVPAKATHERLFDQERVREVLDRTDTNGRVCLDAGAARGVGVGGALITPTGTMLMVAPC